MTITKNSAKFKHFKKFNKGVFFNLKKLMCIVEFLKSFKRSYFCPSYRTKMVTTRIQQKNKHFKKLTRSGFLKQKKTRYFGMQYVLSQLLVVTWLLLEWYSIYLVCYLANIQKYCLQQHNECSMFITSKTSLKFMKPVQLQFIAQLKFDLKCLFECNSKI